MFHSHIFHVNRAIRQILGLHLAPKRMNEVAKHKKKFLRLKHFNPWGQLFPLRFLFVSTVFAKIMFHSYSFDVNKSIKITFRPQFGPQTHEQSGKTQDKITKTWTLQSMRTTFCTLILICISFFFFVKILFHSHSFDVNKSIKITFGFQFGPQMHSPNRAKKKRKNY